MVHPYLRRRDGIEREDYPSPDPAHGDPGELRQILGKTKSVPLFQEQAMRIAMVAARFSPAEANELRRAMATFRRRGTIHTLEERMVSRMVARGYAPDFAKRCFDQIKGFGEYGFPESHAASFAHLVYVSSWLKHHYPEVFAAALLNSQPMGFYAPAQIVRDAREHGVEVREADVSHSHWDSTLEPGTKPGTWAIRLGLRQIDGLREEEAGRIVKWAVGSRQWAVPSGDGVRGSSLPAAHCPLPTLSDLHARTRIRRDTLEKLAAADACRSLGLDRRQALWEVRGLADSPALPLFAHADARETGEEEAIALPEMALSEHVVDDYRTLRLSLKAHPMSFLRERLRDMRILPAGDLRNLGDGARAAIAGIVLVRQRPGSANGVVFMTIEDETGVANAVIWPTVLERYRKVVMASRLVLIRGKVQRHEDIIHVVAQQMEDRSDWLGLLSQEASGMPVPIANADEVRRPEPGSARDKDAGHPRFARARHPRDARVIPRSRDFR
jgi:error-prone DNA polymerase